MRQTDEMGVPNQPTLGRLKQAVRDSVNELNRRDREILGTTERVVVGRLMIYLYQRLQDLECDGWVLDQEYQRIEGEIKRPDGPATPKIVPDLVLHSRMDRTGNLLMIEVKANKESAHPGNGERLHDFAKLALLTKQVDHVDAYGADGDRLYLRRPGDDPPDRLDHRGELHLRSMAPYKHGLWLLIPPQPAAPEYWWWSEHEFLGRDLAV